MVSNWMMELGGKAGGCPPSPQCHDYLQKPPGLSHNVHVYHFLVWFQLVMITHLVGLCSLPLWVIYSVCKYFKSVVWTFTHQVLFSLIFNSICCVHYPCLLMSVFVADIGNKFKSPVWGHTKICGGDCHRHEIWVNEKMTRFRCSYGNWGLVAMPADVQMTYGIFSVHMQWSSHGKSIADNCDVTKWHHNDCLCYLEREIYKESWLGLQGSHLGFWHWTVRSIVESMTLYSSYVNASHGARNELSS